MMSFNDRIPYITIHSQKKTCDWYFLSSEQEAAAKEVAGVLIKQMRISFREEVSIYPILETLWNGLDPSLQSMQTPRVLFSFGFKTPLKLSLQYFKALDHWIDESNAQDQERLAKHLDFLIYILKRESINNGYDLGLSFQEVFLRTPGHRLPPHYREGVDIVVDTHAEYQQQTRTFSYQFAKAWFNYCCCVFKSPSMSSPMNTLVFERYHSNQAVLLCRSLKENMQYPLSSIRGFTHPIELAVLRRFRFHTRGDKCIVVTFESTVCDAKAICMVIASCMKTLARDVLFIFRGECYLDPLIRTLVHTQVLAVAQAVEHTSLLHVVLLTETRPEYRLIDLVPDLSQEDDLGFSPLAHRVGFYLSDARLFSLTYRWRQRCLSEGWLSPEYIKRLQQRREQDVQGGAQPAYETYILSPNGCIDVRPSKRFKHSDLKSRTILSIAQQTQQDLSIHQQQVLNHTQALTQQHSHMQQHSHTQQQSQSRNNQHIWIDTLTFEALLHQLKEAASAACTHGQSTLLNDCVYYTQHQMKARYDFFYGIVHCEKTRFEIAARLFGMAYQISHDGPAPIEWPTYSYRSIQRSLANELIRDITAYSDGLDPAQLFFSKGVLGGDRILDHIHYRAKPYVYSKWHYKAQVDFPKLWLIHDEHSPAHWRGLTGYYVLWTEERLAGLDLDEKNARKTVVESLLEVLHPYKTPSADIDVLEHQFIQLIQWAFPSQPEHAEMYPPKNTTFH